MTAALIAGVAPWLMGSTLVHLETPYLVSLLGAALAYTTGTGVERALRGRQA